MNVKERIERTKVTAYTPHDTISRAAFTRGAYEGFRLAIEALRDSSPGSPHSRAADYLESLLEEKP